jgi:hypothetical protein
LVPQCKWLAQTPRLIAHISKTGGCHENRKDHFGWHCGPHYHQLGGLGPTSALRERLPKLTASIAPSQFKKAVPSERIPAALPKSSKHKTEFSAA